MKITPILIFNPTGNNKSNRLNLLTTVNRTSQRISITTALTGVVDQRVSI
jgi:hypothetical protein